MVGNLKTPATRQTRIGNSRFLLLVLLTTAFGVTTAHAALQFDVFLGYDGTVREASWFPVVCEIKNDGPPFTGMVEVSPGDYSKGQTQQMPVELPTGTVKRLVIPAFAVGRYAAAWNVRLVDERGKVRGEQTALRPRRQIGWEIPLIGSLSRTASGAPVLRPIMGDKSDAQPAAARLQASIFPDNPLVLEGLDSVYVSSEVAADLRASQVNALLSWMNAGGHLIVGIEQISDITASPWLRNVLPCEPKEIRIVPQHPELQAWLRTGGPTNAPADSVDQTQRFPGRNRQRQPGVPIPAPARRSIRPGVSVENPFADSEADAAFELADLPAATCTLRDGRVVTAAGDTPLIITANRGQGRVTALMFSPEREPLKSWRNLPTFWAKLAEVPGVLYVSTDYYAGYGQSADGIFGAMIDSRQVQKLPIGWLLLLLLVYLLVIGPLDQWWLKRIGKPMLTWITFPCYVILFSLLIYLIGYKLRSGEAEFNELHVVDVLRNGERAELRGRTYASIYSPSNQKYPIESRQKFATFRSEFFGSSGGQGSEKATVWQNGDSFKAEVFVPVWTSQLYISDWWQSSALPLTVKVERRGDDEHWQVTVQNQTDRPVKAAQLVIDDWIMPLGELPAGQTKAISVKRPDGIALRDFVMRHGQGFQSAVQQRQFAFGESKGGRISDLANASMAASFVKHAGGADNYNSMGFVVPPGLDLSRVVEHGNAVLLAWVPDFAPVKPLNQFRPKRSFRHTLWRVPVAVGISQ